MQYCNQVSHSTLPQVYINDYDHQIEYANDYAKYVNYGAGTNSDPFESHNTRYVYKRILRNHIPHLKVSRNEICLHSASKYTYQPILITDSVKENILDAENKYNPWSNYQSNSNSDDDADEDPDDYAPNFIMPSNCMLRARTDYVNKVYKYGQLKYNHKIYEGMGYFYMCHIKGTSYYVKHNKPLDVILDKNGKYSLWPITQPYRFNNCKIRNIEYDSDDIVKKSKLKQHLIIIFSTAFNYQSDITNNNFTDSDIRKNGYEDMFLWNNYNIPKSQWY